MPSDFEVTGPRDLLLLAQRLKDAGSRGKGLRNELLRRVRGAAKPAVRDVQQAAYRGLPRSGGLADRVARQVYGVRTSTTGSAARVQIQGRGMKELLDIDRGRLRHPLWGNRDHWYQQQVQPGFFSDTITRRAPQIRTEIERAMGDVARKVGRRF